MVFDDNIKVEWKIKNARNVKKRKIYGIKFIKGKDQTSFKFKEDETVGIIKPIIYKKLNQVGFHDNYRAIKKIGKGNFANV